MAVGWDELGDLSAIASRDALQQLMSDTYPEEKLIPLKRIWTLVAE